MAERLPLDEVLARWRPGSGTWWAEEDYLDSAPCLCCGQPGHYQLKLEAHLRQVGRIDQPVCLGPDVVWDGHHRIVAAGRLGFATVPVEPLAVEGQ